MTYSIANWMPVLVSQIVNVRGVCDNQPSMTERTRNRPLASGRISVFAAVVYLILQYLIGTVMFLTLNRTA